MSLAAALFETAAQSTLAHMIDLVSRGEIESDTGEAARAARCTRC
ncbi:hypothetical protein [Afifella sp. IM 167]|nr:hypothetical protein [Afifella sp. IM 167]